MLTAAILLFTAAAPEAAAPSAPIEEPNPYTMTRAEIRAFNQKVGPNHRYFIRCVRELEIGTNAKYRTFCRTRQDWGRTEQDGNRSARDTVRQLNETNGQTGS